MMRRPVGPVRKGLDRSASPNPSWAPVYGQVHSASERSLIPALKSITKPLTSKLYITVKPQYFDSSYTFQFLVASPLCNPYFRMHGFTFSSHHPVPTRLKVLDNIYFLRMPYKKFIESSP
jgi:hypothetical protein